MHSENSVVNKIFWKKIILNPNFLLNLVSFYEKQKGLGTSYQTLFSFLNMFKSFISLMDDPLPDQFWYFNSTPDTAWKVSIFRVILVRMQENLDQNNSEYGKFLHSVSYSES